MSLSHLTEAAWDGPAPATARRQVQNSVAALRAVLARAGATEAIATSGNGYLLRVDPDDLDALVFEQLLDRARGECDRDAAATLREALALWRGPVLAGLGGMLPEVDGAKLEERRLAALEDVIERELAAGGHARLVSELRGLVAEHPVRERFVGQLMVALYRGGRQAEALAAYHELAARLSAELDLDPGPDLRRRYEAVLREDPELDAPRVAAPAPALATAGGPEQPAQLPADPPAFTGRQGDLARLDRLLSDGHTDSAVVISAIAGTAGVGKTALALHWAHRVRDKFADGQLYVNLHGYSTVPVRPLDALAEFLRALGVPAGRIPTDQDEAAAMYRSLLADRRVLVVLDNARSPEQVRPLLPGNRECVVLVTSRDQMGGLVALDGARRVTLEALPVDDALDLVARVVGAERAAGEPDAARSLVDACGQLPLALWIVAAAAHADRLADIALNPAVEPVRAAFDLAYSRLPDPARRVLRLLGLVPGPDVTVAAVSALAGTTDPLADLVAAHLVTGDGRFTMHDLIHRYAAELAEGDDERDEAARRLHEHYLYTVDAAARRLYPHNMRISLPAPPADVAAQAFSAPAQAAAWLDAERPTLVTTVRHAAAHGPRPLAWRLADALRGYFWLRMNPVDWMTVARAGLDAATADDDPRGQAAAHLSLALLHRRLSQYPQSIDHQNQALDLTRRIGWAQGEATALANLGGLFAELGRLEEAADHHVRALALFEEAGNVGGQAVGFSNLGRVYAELGRLQAAVDHSMQGLLLYRRVGSRGGETAALRNLGVALHGLGRLDEAVDYLTQAVDINRDIGDRLDEAEHLVGLGWVHLDAGRYDEAGRLARAVLGVARESGRRHVEAAVLNLLATVGHRQGHQRSAVEQYQQALRVARDSDGPWFEAEALIGLAGAHRALGELDRAIEYAGQAVTLTAAAGFRVPEGQARTVLAAALLASGHADRAAAEAGSALATHGETGHRLGAARTHLVLGRAMDRDGRVASSRTHWRTALALAEEVGAAPEIAEARSLLGT